MAKKFPRTCEQCSVNFLSAKSTGRFCGKGCFDKWQSGERKTVECGYCKTPFESSKDHGVWKRFCSRSCFCAGAIKPEEKMCSACGGFFLAGKTNTGNSEDGRRIYCSNPCRYEGLRNGEYKRCVNCLKPFYIAASQQKQRPDDSCCSKECADQYYVGTLSRSFRDGLTVHTQSGNPMRYAKRDGYVGAYMGEHQIAASKALGRLVKRGEVVLRINRNPQDNRPENLFLCESMSEAARRRQGSLPWPSESNLAIYEIGKMQ